MEKNKDLKTDVVILKDNKTEYVVTNKFLNHDIYDSLVSSGKINFWGYDLQQQIQNIFRMIKYHNQYLQTIKRITNQDIGGDKKQNACYHIMRYLYPTWIIY